VPTEESMKGFDLDLAEIATSRLVVSEPQRAEQRASVVDRRADELLTPAERARLAERLWESALILLDQAEPDQARLCTAAAELILDESVPGSANPFVRRLFEKLIKRDAPTKESP
jgi:hypothetical protein